MIIDSPIISGSYAATGSLNQVGNVTITGSLTVTGPIIGALTGSVDSASFATTASYVSPNTQINTASFATTASYARTVDFNNTVVTSSFAVTASYVSPNTQINTASFAVTASYAKTVDFNNTVVTSSYSLTASYVSPTTPIDTASFAITASYVSPNTQINTSSFAITSSYAANAELLDGLDSSAFTSVSSFNTFTSSILSYTSSASSRLSSLETASGSAITRLGALEVASGSAISRLNALEVTSGSNIARISSLETASGSAITRLNALEVASGSAISRLNAIELTTGSLNAASGSAITRLNSIENKTGSYATTGSNTFVGGQYFSSSFSPTGFTTTASLYTDGGLRVTKDAYISGTLYLNNVTVFGTQSVAYISSSQLNIGTNIITVNTDTPSVRFGGLAVYDSGSTGLTGSMLWDSQDNQWIYSNPTGSEYDSAVFLVGPRNSGVLGNEPGISCNFLSKGNGMHHMTSSGIFEDGSRTCFYNSGFITSTGVSCFTTSCAASIVGGTVSGTTGNFSNCITAGARSFVTGTPGYLFDVQTTDTNKPRFQVYVDDTNGVDLVSGYDTTAKGLRFNTGGNIRANITSTGITCFACQVCAPSFISSGTICSTGNTCFGGMSIINSCLGIGTATPGAKLQVYGNMQIYAESSGCSDPLIFGGETGTSKKAIFLENFWMVYQGHDNEGHKFRSVNAEGACTDDVIITGGGNVGIGIPSPAYKLDVNGTGRFTACSCVQENIIVKSANTSFSKINIDSVTGASSQLAFLENGTQKGVVGYRPSTCNVFLANATGDILTISCTGNVGIGTSSPANKLDVVGDGIRTSADQSTSAFLVLAGSSSEGRITVSSYGGYQPMTFYTGGSERMRITSGGNVGIGTTSPVVRLDYGSTTGQAFHLYTSDADYYGINMAQYDSESFSTNIFSGNNGLIKFRTASGTTTQSTRMTIIANGNVGIGTTSPDRLFHINGNTSCSTPLQKVQNDGVGDAVTEYRVTGASWYIGIDNSDSDKFKIGQDPLGTTDRFTIADGGSVGIGTASPTNKLEVDGGSSAVALRISTTNTSNGTAALILANSSKAAFNDGVKIAHGGGFTNITDLCNTNIMTWDMSNTRVGIGTVSPTDPLTIGGGQTGLSINSATTGDAYVRWRLDGTVYNDAYVDRGTGNFLIGPTVSSALILKTGNTERMRITSGGLVSINQTSGYAIFNVTGIDCAWGEGIVMNSAPNGYNAINFRLEGRAGSCFTGTWQLGKESSSTGNGELFTLNKAGLTGGAGYRADAAQQWKTNGDSVFGFNVGIGTCTPAVKLDVNGNTIIRGSLDFRATGTNNGNLTINDNGGGTATINNSSNSFLNITSASRTTITGGDFIVNNNVGINTTSPNEKLDVNGAIQARGTSVGFGTTQCITQLDFYLGAARLLSFGGNSTTCGCFRFYSAGQNNNGGSDVATISGGGVACFKGTICTGGHIIPISNGSQDLGSSSLRWCTVYTSDLSLNNGIGNYTIVEGESDLFLYNNNSCKVFKFLLQEVCPEIAPAKRSI